MKISTTLAFLTAIVSVSGNAYDFCCCHQKHKCHQNSTKAVVATAVSWQWNWIIWGEALTKGNGAPDECGGSCWAVNNGDKIGVVQMRHMCAKYGAKGYGHSQCFNWKYDHSVGPGGR